jgi:hypothetical protein
MIDEQTATWRVVKDRCDAGTSRARAILDRHGTSHDDTVFERGRLSAFQEVLALANPPKLTPPPKQGPSVY